MKSGGSVIFSIVPWVSLLPSSSRSSQNNIGPTERNSLPCRYQSLSLLTIILICLSLLFSLPKPQRLLPTLRKQGFPVIVTDSWTWRFLWAGFSVTAVCNVTSPVWSMKLQYFSQRWRKHSGPEIKSKYWKSKSPTKVKAYVCYQHA